METRQPILPYLKGMYRPEEPSDTISTAISLDREDKAKAAKAVSKWIRQTSSVFKVRLLIRFTVLSTYQKLLIFLEIVAAHMKF